MTNQDTGHDPVSSPQHVPHTGRLLGVDWGERRIGLAVSDPDQMIANPLDTLVRRTGRRFPMRDLRAHLDTVSVVGVVVGLPLTPDGTESEAARKARETGELIASKSGLPVVFQDERFTSARVLATAREMKVKTGGRKPEVDRLAAAVMLQTFLDGRRS